MNSQIAEIKNVLGSRFAFLLLACLIPPSLFLRPGIVSILIIWFFALSLYNLRQIDLPDIKLNAPLLLPILLYLLYAVGLSYTDYVETGVGLLIRKIHLVLLPIGFLIVARRTNDGELRNLTFAAFTVAIILATLVCLVMATVNVVEADSFGVRHGNVYHPYFQSHLLTRPLDLEPVYMSLFCNFGLLTVLLSSLIRIGTYKALFALYLILFIVLCGSLAGIASAGLIVVCWLISCGYRKLVISALVICVVGSILLLWSNPDDARDVTHDAFRFTYLNDDGELTDHEANKLQIWKAAMSAAAEESVFGYGTGNGQAALEGKFIDDGLANEVRDSLNPHNQFLSTLLDLGIVGLAVLIIVLIVPLVRAFTRQDALGVAFLLMIVIFFSVESVLLRQKGIVFFSFFYSVIVCHRSKS